MIDYLYLHGDVQVGVLARELSQQVGSISHHLRMLERAGLVVRVPERATDGRTSWWRLVRVNLTWSVDDFAESPSQRAEARAAERVHVEHHFARLAAWKRESETASEEWRRASFSSDVLAMATPEEITALNTALAATWGAWREAIDTDDGQERRPVFVFAHGFPTRP